MTPEERQQLNDLQQQVTELKQQFRVSYTQKLALGRGLINAKSATATPGVYYVAETSAGSPTRKLTFKEGILTSDTN